MGNDIKTRLNADSDKYYTYCGRERDIEKVCRYLEGAAKMVVQISGMKKVGKSRLLTQLLKKYHGKRKCILHDFSLKSSKFSSISVTRYLAELRKKFGFVTSETEQDGLTVSDMSKELISEAESLDEDVVLFLDNVDKVFECEGFKDIFLEFLKDICESANSKLKVVFTSAIRSQLTSNAFVSHDLTVMSDKEIEELFYKVIKEKTVNIDANSNEEFDDNNDIGDDFPVDIDCDSDSSSGVSLYEEIVSQKNKIFNDALIRLCSGLPTLATMIATELTANNGLLEPRDMVVLVLEDILNTLSPDCYPLSDRAEHFKGPIETLKTRRELLENMNANFDESNTAKADKVVQMVEDARSDAEAKQKTRPLLDHNVVRFSHKGKMFTIQAIYRDCLLAMKPLRTVSDEGKSDDHVRELLKLGRIKLSGIDELPHEIKTSQRELEDFLKNLEASTEPRANHLISQPSQEEDTVTLSTSHDGRELGRIIRNMARDQTSDQTSGQTSDQTDDRVGDPSRAPTEHSLRDGVCTVVGNQNLCRPTNDVDTSLGSDKPTNSYNSLSGPAALSYRQQSIQDNEYPTRGMNNSSMDSCQNHNNDLNAQTNIYKEPINSPTVFTNDSVEVNNTRAVDVTGDCTACTSTITDRLQSVEDNCLYDGVVRRANETNTATQSDVHKHGEAREMTGTGVKIKLESSNVGHVNDSEIKASETECSVDTGQLVDGLKRRKDQNKPHMDSHENKSDKCETGNNADTVLSIHANLDSSKSLFDSD